jgi:hypothetical protein
MATINSTNNFGAFNFIVDATAGKGTHQTISLANSAASSGSNIYIRPGTYTENFVAKAGVNYIAIQGDSQAQALVNIVGTITVNNSSGTGKILFSGLSFNNPSAAVLNMTQSTLQEILFDNCYFFAANAPGTNCLNAGNSNVDTSVKFRDCLFDNSTNISMFSATAGTHYFYNCKLRNSALVTSAYFYIQGTATVNMFYTEFFASLSTAVSGTINMFYCIGNTVTTSAACLSLSAASTCTFVECFFTVAANAAISVGASTTVNFYGGYIETSGSAVNVINGSGILNYSPFGFSPGTTNNVNVTTTNLKKFGPKIFTNGITFDGGTNLLSTFTEGTFTPVIVGGTTPGTATYIAQIGRYQRVGNRVTCTIIVTWTSHTGTGELRIATLPFVSKNVANVSSYVASYFTDGTTGSIKAYFIPPNTSYIALITPSDPIGTNTSITAIGTCRVTIDYEV